MKNAIFAFALIPFFGAGCWSAAQDKNQTPYLQVPGQEQQQPQPAAEVSPAAIQPVQDSLPSEPSLVPSQSDYVKIANQKAGNEVMLDYIVIHKRGFAAILNDKDGRPNDIIAASGLLNAGEIRETFIKAKLQAGKTYWVGLYADNGDGRFDAKTDIQIRDAKDAAVMAKFVTE